MTESLRLHPVSPVFGIVRHVRGLLIPGAAVLVVGGDSWQLWLMLLFLPSAAYEIIRFFTFRYRLTDEQLVTSLAFIGRTERSLRFDRIQNIESVQGVVHRLLGVAEIRVDTGAGGKPEAVLRVVPVGEVERLRERVFGRGQRTESCAGVPDAVAPAAESAVVILKLAGLDYVVLGLITMRGAVLIALAMGAAWELKLFKRLGSVREWLFDRLLAVGENELAVGLFAAGMILLFLTGLGLASIAWAVLRFGGFRLFRVGEEFHIEAGLLTRVRATVPRHRIQAVRLTRTLQHRMFGKVSIAVETAGGVDPDSNQESSFGRRWFAPLVSSGSVAAIARSIRPSLSLDADGWCPLSVRGRRRMLRKSVLVAVPIAGAVGAGMTAALGPVWGGGIGVALGAWLIVHGWRAASLARYRRTDGWIGRRSGVATRHTIVAFLDSVQVIEVTESPFDRRAGMATLRIDTAGGMSAGPRVDLPMLDAGEANNHAAEVARAAERAGFVW